ncbi:MAG: fatty acid desaturase, partial [Myxococcales bacterium]|nr:fatty acid desaturase [Myxococcales bacterium]
MTTPAPIPASLRARLQGFAVADGATAWRELVITLSALSLGWTCIAWASVRAPGLALLLAVPNGLMLMRAFIIQHDCGHGSFLPGRAANDRLGTFLGLLTLAPYHYWRRNHAHHHVAHGNLDAAQLGGLDTLTVAAYRRSSPLARLSYRIYRRPLVLVSVGPIYQWLLKHRLPLDIPTSWRREWMSVLLGDLVIAAAVTIAYFSGGWSAVATLAFVYLPSVLVAFGVGIWLFYIQHQFPGAYWRRREDWSFDEAGLYGSSFYDLPAPLAWLTGYIGYHHVHHLAPRVPLYRLRA